MIGHGDDLSYLLYSVFILFPRAVITDLDIHRQNVDRNNNVNMNILVRFSIRGYPAKRVLSAMRKHGG